MKRLIPEPPPKVLLENDRTLALDGTPAGVLPKMHTPQPREAKACIGLFNRVWGVCFGIFKTFMETKIHKFPAKSL